MTIPITTWQVAEKPLDRSAMEKAKKYCYTLMGWDEKGVPLPEKVQELYEVKDNEQYFSGASQFCG